jgi:ribosomal-protein-alanine N-acetyltransferase
MKKTLPNTCKDKRQFASARLFYNRIMKPPERFETERLILRIPHRDDAPSIFAAYAQDPEATRYLTWRPHKNLDETYAIIERILSLWEEGAAYSYAITLKDTESVVGMIALHPDDFMVGLGYVLARSFWGKGYMTEAVRKMTNWLLEQPDMYRVFAVCDVENPASARVMEKAGLTREGTLRRYSIHPNISSEPRDSYIYSIVK